jgi:hypothetical protein
MLAQPMSPEKQGLAANSVLMRMEYREDRKIFC